MFGMSVNEVPGWLVTMAPSGIGVPVAATPGLVPHCEVLTALVLAAALAVLLAALLVVLVLLVLLVELELELLQPAAAMAMAAASTIVLRALMAWAAFGICALIVPPLRVP
jgi:hypothetical protein